MKKPAEKISMKNNELVVSEPILLWLLNNALKVSLLKKDILVNKLVLKDSFQKPMDCAENPKFISKVKTIAKKIFQVLKAFASLSVLEVGKKKEFGAKDLKHMNQRGSTTKSFFPSLLSDRVIKIIKLLKFITT